MTFAPEKALAHRIVLIAGEEESLRRRALGEILSLTGDDDFDRAVYDGSQDPQEWLGSAGTAPFLAERRTIIVRQLLRGEPAKVSPESLKSLPESALLILVADDEAGDDSKQQRLATVRKNWEKLVSGAKGLVLKFDANAKDLPGTLRAEAARLDKSLTPRAAQLLAEMCGGSLSRGIEELEKLAVYVGNEKNIGEHEVKTLALPAHEWNVFRLIDSVVKGDAAEAIRQLRILVGSPSKAEEAAFRSLFPLIGRQLRLLWQARVCVEGHCHPTNAPPSVLATFPDKPNLASEPPYRQSALMAAAQKIDLVRLTKCFVILSDADAKLKGMLPAYGTVETLEQMILQMLDTLKAR